MKNNRKPYTMVDHLADQLSLRTGSKFEVLRVPIPAKNPAYCRRGANIGPIGYGLKATRNGVSYQFQGNRYLTNNELKRWLASINDMIAMEFINVSK